MYVYCVLCVYISINIGVAWIWLYGWINGPFNAYRAWKVWRDQYYPTTFYRTTQIQRARECSDLVVLYAAVYVCVVHWLAWLQTQDFDSLASY